MGALEPGHLIIVLAIILIVFGPGKLPQLGKAIGDGVRELKRASTDDGHASATDAHGPAAQDQTERRCPQYHGLVSARNRFCGARGAQITSETAPPHEALEPRAFADWPWRDLDGETVSGISCTQPDPESLA
jgi:TatA/E family protein of Tat protein translocase